MLQQAGILPMPSPHYPPTPGRIEYIVDAPYTWQIIVNIFQKVPDSLLFCSTHKNEISVLRTSLSSTVHQTKVCFLNGVNYPNKDFEIMFNDSAFNAPIVELAQKIDIPDASLPSRCAMMHFVPRHTEFVKFDAEGKEIPDEIEEAGHFMENTKAEYLFIIDRSGSMDGE